MLVQGLGVDGEGKGWGWGGRLAVAIRWRSSIRNVTDEVQVAFGDSRKPRVVSQAHVRRAPPWR